MVQVPDLAAMRLLLQQWIAEVVRLAAPAGRWAIQRNHDGRPAGSPDTWGNGYASETTHTLATWAFSRDVHEIFAVLRPGNARAAATVRHNGMHWAGETTKYFGTDLQVFRLRQADLDRTAPEGHHPPNLGKD